MGATKAADFAFEPKVWAGHVQAYFDRKLVVGQFARRDNTLTAAPGETVNYPFFKKIGDAEEPDEDSGLSVDKLQDDAFSCTVKEVAKAVGVKRRALRKSAARREEIFTEVQNQIARVHAEKVDKDLITEMNTTGNYTAGFVAAANTDLAKITNIAKGKILAFGDKHDQSVAMFVHSFCYMDLITDPTAGFLKADANDPFWGMAGFMGRLLGMAMFTLDTMPEYAGGIGGKKAFYSFIIKADPYGIITAEEPEMDQDYDLLHREHLFTGGQYYGVKAFHGKVAADDKRICRNLFATSIDV
mgnify:CR=1 FL=1